MRSLWTETAPRTKVTKKGTKGRHMNENETSILYSERKQVMTINKTLSQELIDKRLLHLDFQQSPYERRFFLVFSEEKTPTSQELKFSGKGANLVMNSKTRIAAFLKTLGVEPKEGSRFFVKLVRPEIELGMKIMPFRIRTIEEDLRYNPHDKTVGFSLQEDNTTQTQTA